MHGRSASGSGLTVRASSGARVAFLVFEEDGSDVVDGNVDGICDARNGQDSLTSRELGSNRTGKPSSPRWIQAAWLRLHSSELHWLLGSP